MTSYAIFTCPECNAHTRFVCSIIHGKLISPKSSRGTSSTRISCSGCGKGFWKRNLTKVKDHIYTSSKPEKSD